MRSRPGLIIVGAPRLSQRGLKGCGHGHLFDPNDSDTISKRDAMCLSTDLNSLRISRGRLEADVSRVKVSKSKVWQWFCLRRDHPIGVQ